MSVFLSEALQRAQRDLNAEKFEAVARELRERTEALQKNLEESQRLLALTRSLAAQCQREALLCRLARRVPHQLRHEHHSRN